MKKRRGSMKIITLTLFAAAVGMAQSQSSTPAAATPAGTAAASKAAAKAPSNAPDKKPPQPSKPSPGQKTGEQSIPAGAALVEPFLYRYTDSSGKTWMYRQTPFGVSKWEESSIPAPQAPVAKSEPVVVTDLGDSVRFEKKTPFGAGTWVRKKTELNDEEKALVDGSSPSSEPSSSLSKSANAPIADDTKKEDK